MGGLIRAHDWAATPLGPIEQWPGALRNLVDLVLVQGFPTNCCVGPERVLIYNDGYARMIGAKHPDGFGRDVREVFAEVAPNFAPMLDRAFDGETVTVRDQYNPFKRHEAIEGAWFDIGYSPVRDESGAVIAAFVVHVETTERVLSDRSLRASEERQGFLLKLSDAVRPLNDPAEIIAAASEALGRHLGAGQVVYAENDLSGEYVTIKREWNDGSIPSNARRHRLEDFGSALITDLRRGRSTAIHDVALDPRTSSPEALATFARASIKALLNVPLIKNGRMVAVLGVHSEAPRTWRAEDVAVTEEVAERIWAAVERARADVALRTSGERLRNAVQIDPVGVLFWSP